MVAQAQVSMSTVSETPADSLLRRALVGDAIFCGLAGTAMVAASSWLSEFTGLTPNWVPAAIGAGVLLWAAELVWMSRRERLSTTLGAVVVGGGVAWVVASYAILLTGALDLTTAGAWTVGILAEIVAVFAAIQFLGLRRLRAAA